MHKIGASSLAHEFDVPGRSPLLHVPGLTSRSKLAERLADILCVNATTFIEPPQPGSIIVDLCGTVAPGLKELWRIVDAAGVAVFHSAASIRYHGLTPYVVSLFLIATTDQEKTWKLLAEAHLSSVHRLRDASATAIGWMLRRGMRQRDATGPDWHPPLTQIDPMASRMGAWIRDSLEAVRYRLTNEVWAIGRIELSSEDLISTRTIEPERWITVPRSWGYIADPFPHPRQLDAILCELWATETQRGMLKVLTVAPGDIVCLESLSNGPACHLSYPFTWEEDGRIYCLPEMGEADGQILYELRADNSLEPICEIAANQTISDPTPFRHNSLYWLSYADNSIGSQNNLCLMWAEHLTGPWTPHPLNPVKLDIRSSRPGGTPFRAGDSLYRPAQNCARTYGAALAINKVLVCTPRDYAEETVAVLSPAKRGKFPHGLHTIAIGNGFALVDGKRLVSGPKILHRKTIDWLCGHWTNAAVGSAKSSEPIKRSVFSKAPEGGTSS